MCISESSTKLDPLEFNYMIQLIYYLTNVQLPLDFGVGISTFYDYSNVPKLWKWNSCYFDGLKKGPRGGEMKPQSLIERKVYRNFFQLGWC
jgi:hypothetical protein